MVERALIHVTGPGGAGKSTLIEQLVRSCDNRSLVIARCTRDDRLRAPRESRPRASKALRRYMQAGASNAFLYRFPASHADGDTFYASHLMEDYSDSVLLEGDRPLEWVDLTVFVAPPLVEGSGLLRRVTRDRAAERARAHDVLGALLHEPDGVDRLLASHLGDLGGLLTPVIAKTREATRTELLAVIAKERKCSPRPVSTDVTPMSTLARDAGALRGAECRGQRDGAGGGDRAGRGFGEVRAGLEADELRRLDQAVEERGDPGAPLGARAVVIPAADGKSRVILPMSGFVHGFTISGTHWAAAM